VRFTAAICTHCDAKTRYCMHAWLSYGSGEL
jgi:hypothetical protein